MLTLPMSNNPKVHRSAPNLLSSGEESRRKVKGGPSVQVNRLVM
jgi:hypothetical protein